MKDSVKENLERKFNALLLHKKGEHFASFELDYVEYLAKLEGLGTIMEVLINEGRINKDTLTHLLKVYFIRIMSKKIESGCSDDELIKDLNLPAFITNKIQDELRILESLKEITEKRLKNNERTNKRIESFNLTDSANTEEDLFVLQKLHNDIMEKMTSTETGSAFDSNTSLLQFQGKEILISRGKDSDSHYLLETIFKDKKKNWNYDEIAGDWQRDYDKNSWNKYYNAGYKVNEKIAKETDVKDFLHITKKAVSIKKKYLE